MSTFEVDLVKDSTMKQIAAILAKKGGMQPQSYDDVLSIVRLGLAPSVFSIGDVIEVSRGDTTINMVVMDFIESGQTPIGDIVLHDKTKQYGMVMQSEKLLYTLQFDAREAFYHTTSGLAAGTYHFTLGAHTWVYGDVGKVFQFTLTHAVPAGGQLVMKQNFNVTLEGGGIDAFSSGTAKTPIETVTMTVGSGGINLGTLGEAINAEFNCCERALLGSNKWGTSAMRQHLNSDKVAGQVWTPQTKWDRPPSWVDSTAGFMDGLDSEFVKICADVELLTVLNTVCDTTSTEGAAGTGYETTVDKYFFPSRPEVFAGSDNASDKGDAWAYYKVNSDAPGGSSNPNDDSNRIKTNAAGAAQYWWLRSPNIDYGNYVHHVDPVGGVDVTSAESSIGVVPACVIA